MTSRPQGKPRAIIQIVIAALVALAVVAVAVAQQLAPRSSSPAAPARSSTATPRGAPAWGLAGGDAGRSGRSPLPAPVPPVALRWRYASATGLRQPVVGADGTVYLARADGALVALDPAGRLRRCVPVSLDTASVCAVAPPSASSGAAGAVALDGAPNALDVAGGRLLVVGRDGALAALAAVAPGVTTGSAPLWRAARRLTPDGGLAPGPDGATFYGVAPARGPTPGQPAFAVAAIRGRGQPAPGWRETPIATRRLTPVTVAPDGTILVAAAAAASGGDAALYALDRRGRVRWRVPLAPGRPSYPSIAATPGGGGGWTCLVAVAGATRSWVIAADAAGRVNWRWSTGHTLDVTDGGAAVARDGGLGYIGSDIGVYGLDPRRRRSWLFFNTRLLGQGTAGAPTIDGAGTVLVGTEGGTVFDVRPDGTVRWRYDVGGDARMAPALAPRGVALAGARDAAGATTVVALGYGASTNAAGAKAPGPVVPPPPAAAGAAARATRRRWLQTLDATAARCNGHADRLSAGLAAISTGGASPDAIEAIAGAAGADCRPGLAPPVPAALAGNATARDAYAALSRMLATDARVAATLRDAAYADTNGRAIADATSDLRAATDAYHAYTHLAATLAR